MKQVLFATTNPAKVEYYAKELKQKEINVVTIRDLDINIEVDENGKTGLENAKIKAKAYFEQAHIPTIAIDDNLFLEGVAEEEQPGVNVRRVNGKRLSDQESIQYYAELVSQYGGKINAKWIKGVAIYDGKEMKSCEFSKSGFYFISTPSQNIHTGYPLDSLSMIPEFNKYLSELTEKELKQYKQKEGNKEIFEFILRNI